MSSRRDKHQLVVIGPTASGKSDFTDRVARESCDFFGRVPPVLLFDSMQVYREIPVITNQGRGVDAQPRGIVSVTDEWSVARHIEFVQRREPWERPLIESGTGMYLTSYLLGIGLADRVDPDTRARAEENVSRVIGEGRGGQNFRRMVREEELRLYGSRKRGSIWSGSLRDKTTIVYTRPDRSLLDENIRKRSEKIVSGGVQEAGSLSEMMSSGQTVSQTVLDAIGVRELLEVRENSMSGEDAVSRIAARTRQLSRRQMRWFDKLVKTLERDPLLEEVRILDTESKNSMHDVSDTIGAWIG